MFTYPPEARQIIEEIHKLNIQGATEIALAGLDVIEIVKNLKVGSVRELRRNIQKALGDLLSARPTEPCMRNAVQLVLYAISKAQGKEGVLTSAQAAIDSARQHMVDSRKRIVETATEALAGHKRIYTHCHSSTVTQAIAALFAKGDKKTFQVFCTETRPRYQGRRTAEELAEAGIPVTLTVDSAFPLSLDSATVVLLGADVVTSSGGVYNKVGSSLISHAAARRNIPLYVLTDSWKYAMPSFEKNLIIEERPPDEIWENPPKGVRICNPAFDRIEPRDITGIITELGLCSPGEFAARVGRAYPFLED